MVHETTIEYPGGMEKLVEDIFDMRYDKVEQFFDFASKKLKKDANADEARGRILLATRLNASSVGCDIVRG